MIDTPFRSNKQFFLVDPVIPKKAIGYAWLILAYSNGYEQAKDDILISNKAMTASEMEKAEEETAKLREKLIK